MERIWHELYHEAKKKLKAKDIPPFIETGTSACAIASSNDNIYSGVSINTNSNANTNAEKSAIISMINNNEYKIKKIVILNELEETIPPSIECYDYILELRDSKEDIKVLIDYDNQKIVDLSDLIPDWWGTYRNNK